MNKLWVRMQHQVGWNICGCYNMLSCFDMHSTTMLACHEGKCKSWGQNSWSCRCFNACEWFILFADHELRLASGFLICRDLLVKRRNEKKKGASFVISYELLLHHVYWHPNKQWKCTLMRGFSFLLLLLVGWEEPACSQSNRRNRPGDVQRDRASKNFRAGDWSRNVVAFQ